MHNFREFLGEVGVVVLGIVIALAGEQTVDFFHWRDSVAIAEAAMTKELRSDDLPQAYARVAMHPCLVQQLQRIDDALDANLDRRAITALTKGYAPQWRSWDTEAWRAAETAGVTSHMSAERNEQWEGPYDLMPLLQDQADREATQLPGLQPGGRNPGHLTEAERDRINVAVEQLRQVDALLTRTANLSLSFGADAGVWVTDVDQQKILGQLREGLGGCVIDPPRPEVLKTGRHRTAG
jgi:hypothetical protein